MGVGGLIARNRTKSQRKLAHQKQIIRELHPNQESYIERVVDLAPTPIDTNTYGLKAALGVILWRLWLYSETKHQPHKPRYQYISEREQCRPLIEDRDNGILLF